MKARRKRQRKPWAGPNAVRARRANLALLQNAESLREFGEQVLPDNPESRGVLDDLDKIISQKREQLDGGQGCGA